MTLAGARSFRAGAGGLPAGRLNLATQARMSIRIRRPRCAQHPLAHDPLRHPFARTTRRYRHRARWLTWLTAPPASRQFAVTPASSLPLRRNSRHNSRHAACEPGRIAVVEHATFGSPRASIHARSSVEPDAERALYTDAATVQLYLSVAFPLDAATRLFFTRLDRTQQTLCERT